jgi:hypothetical protein
MLKERPMSLPGLVYARAVFKRDILICLVFGVDGNFRMIRFRLSATRGDAIGMLEKSFVTCHSTQQLTSSHVKTMEIRDGIAILSQKEV